MKIRHASTAMATAALALLAAAPGAAAQVPEVDLPPVPDMAQEAAGIAQNPPTSAISDQYHEIADQVAEAVAPAAPPQPAAPPVAPAAPKPAPAPEYHPKADKYHSEDVTVTQAQPENVNVSIRINSPGDDGPVVQVNNSGGPVDIDVVDNHAPAPQAPAAPAPDAGGGLPANWTWIWTSACFGGSGGGGAPAQAAATTGWDWRWSCGDADPIADIDVPGPDSFGEVTVPDVPEALAETPLAAAGELAPAAANLAKPTARPDRRVEAAVRTSPRRPPPSAPAALARGRPAAAPPLVAVAGPATAVVPRADRRAAAAKPQARPARAATTDFPPGADGPSAGAASGLGAAMSLLLGGWTAVLIGALALALKQIWLRRWSGPPRRKPAPRAMRLERPG